MHALRQSGTKRTLLAASLLVMLLTACASTGGSETERTICRELRADLPTYSRRDTPETLESGARFVGTFEAVCGAG
jgi:hypothetical protein